MKSILTTLALILILLPHPTSAKPSDFKKKAGGYIGKISNVKYINGGAPELGLTNPFYITLPTGKGVGRGGFLYQDQPGNQWYFFRLRFKIKKAVLRQGGKKAIYVGRLRASYEPNQNPWVGQHRAVVLARGKGCKYQGKLMIVEQGSSERIEGNLKAKK